MRVLYSLIFACSLILTSCNNEPSLQKYFVANTENKNFIAVDVSPTILNLDKTKLSVQENEALKSFEKMNVLAFKINDTNKASFASERDKVKTILKDEKYQQLIKYGSGKEGASISFVGDDKNVEEFVVFANKKDVGFAVVRILGQDMNPNNIITLMSIMKKSNVDLAQLQPLLDMVKK